MSGTLAGIASAELLERLRRLVQRGNAVEADLLAHLGEVDARQLYLEEACPSMFTYCCRVLHFAEGVAYKRIQAARAARRHPQILESLRCGDLHLTAVGLLGPKLTEPLGAERYRVEFTADRETHAQLEELRALMRHQIPDGDVGKILAKAISGLLERVRKQKFAETSAPRSAPPPNDLPSRHVPAAIRRAVWERDGGRCTYVSEGGRHCDSKKFLEFDHADGWSSTRAHSIAAITLRCRSHNQLRARQDFGEKHMAQFRRTGSKSSSSQAERVCP